ncbi:MAG: diaminopimelate decarboxylase [Planctomycetota bacterium]
MDHFEYRAGELWADGVRVGGLVDRFGSPLYLYAARTIDDHIARFKAAFEALDPEIHYAVKACGNLAILQRLAGLGVGADAVSIGEVERARLAGVPSERIVMAGVAKTDDEMAAALDPARGPIGRFNIESEREPARVDAIAGRLGVRATASLRVNPDIDAHTHAYTTTGTNANKFGVPIERAEAVFEAARSLRHLELDGLHVHLGSPIQTIEPYERATRALLALIDRLEARGDAVRSLSLGGGFAADYESGQAPWAKDYARAIVPLLEDRARAGLRIAFEPGRTIMASAGVLLVRVIDVKRTPTKRFLICDAGMNALTRPALYGARHFVWPIEPGLDATPTARTFEPALAGGDAIAVEPADVVGPLCESSDVLAVDRKLPPVEPGAVLAVFTSGAYGMSMSTTLNDRPRPAEVLVDGDQTRLIRPRQTLDELLGPEVRALDA